MNEELRQRIERAIEKQLQAFIDDGWLLNDRYVSMMADSLAETVMYEINTPF